MNEAAFGIEYGGDRSTAALAGDNDHLAVAVLIVRAAAIDPVFFEIGLLQISAEIPAIDLSHLSLTADNATI
jgi:hypothetical protein